jgi:hypothetical protein
MSRNRVPSAQKSLSGVIGGEDKMRFDELAEMWAKFPKRGRLLFLIGSRFMATERGRAPEFADLLDRYLRADFVGLPWELQDEFGVYAETTFFEKWMKGGNESANGGNRSDEALRYTEQKD